MKAVISVLMIFMIGLGGTGAFGQTSSRATGELQTAFSNDPEVKRWKAALRALEAVDQDPATPPGIKERNLLTLQKRRSELQVLIKSKVYDLQQYKARLEPQKEILSAEIKEATTEISNLQRDLEDIQKGSATRIATDNSAEGPAATEEIRDEADRADTAAEATNPPEPETSDATTRRARRAAEPAAGGTGSAQRVSQANDAGTGSGATAQGQNAMPDCTTFKSDPKTFSLVDKYGCLLADSIKENKGLDKQAGFDPLVEGFPLTLIAIARKDRPAYLVEAEEKRVDKQVGAGPSNSGTTSLTVKGSGPKILGLAVENGALTQSTSGSTITFRGNPLGIAQALANKGYIESYDQAEKYALTRFLKKLSFSASFDTSRGQMTEAMEGMPPPMPLPNVFTADRQQLSEVAVRYEIYNQRDPRSKRYRADWEAFLDGEANLKLLQQTEKLMENLVVIPDGQIIIGGNSVVLPAGIPISGRDLIKTGGNICIRREARDPATNYPTLIIVASANPSGAVSLKSSKILTTACGVVSDFKPASEFSSEFKDPVLQKWYVTTQKALQAVGPEQVETVLSQRIEELPVDQLAPETLVLMRDVSVGFDNYLKAKQMIIDKINQGGIVTFEYTNTRNVNSPNLSNFRLIAEKGAGGKFDATFNGSLTIFDKLPMGMTKRIRDFQFSGQADALLGDMGDAGNIVLSFSGRYERLLEDAMTPDGMMVMDTKGDIAIGQAKLTIPVKGGFKIPISVTFANRTELIKEKEIRGNIGFTFDLDALFARFKL